MLKTITKICWLFVWPIAGLFVIIVGLLGCEKIDESDYCAEKCVNSRTACLRFSAGTSLDAKRWQAQCHNEYYACIKGCSGNAAGAAAIIGPTDHNINETAQQLSADFSEK